jgi:hypothetical protein
MLKSLVAATNRRPGAKAPCICDVFRRAEALRSHPKTKGAIFSAASTAQRVRPKAKTRTFSAPDEVHRAKVGLNQRIFKSPMFFLVFSFS